MGHQSRRVASVRQTALCLLLVLAAAGWALADFSPQKRVGYLNGDQWEPAIAADNHGHVYILYPQYGAVPDCPSCTAPSIALAVSNDGGLTWQSSHALLPFATGQFDPQIAVDPLDRQAVYASWLQNNKRDIVVARSTDFGHSWNLSLAKRGGDDADKPVLAVRGRDVYVGFNHEEQFFVASSHDFGDSFTASRVSTDTGRGWSLGGGATVDPAGNVFFGWTVYVKHELARHPVNVNVSRSADGGRSWTTTLLDVSSAPPDCRASACQTGFLGAQIALTSDTAGTLYAVWNAGAANGGPERIYFSSSTTAGATWTARADLSAAPGGAESAFPTITAGTPGDVRVAWMDARKRDTHNRSLWNTFYRSSTNGGATWSNETRISGLAHGYDYISAEGFHFPFGDYFTLAIDGDGTTHAVWGEGQNYKSPGSIWYTRGR